MNAHSHLLSQGWLGPGHSLQPSRPNGLKKYLLVTQKADTHGIGKKNHNAHADQWWLTAFDNTLKDINFGTTDGAKKPEVAVTAKQTMGPRIETLRMGKWFRNGGLYAGFVRGEEIKGTLREGDIKPAPEVQAAERKNANEKRKRKRDHGSLAKGGRTSKNRTTAKSGFAHDERLDQPGSCRTQEDNKENAIASGLVSLTDEMEDAPSGLVADDAQETKEQRRQRRRDTKRRKAQVAAEKPTPPKLKDESRHKSKHKSSKHRREDG